MDIGSIDYWANNKASYLHRAAPLAKVTAAFMVILAAVVARDWPVLLAIYALIAVAVAAARLPLIKLVTLAAYPAIFTALFIISSWDGSLARPAVLLLRSMTAALASVLLISTTPYPEVFATLRPLMPRLVNDGLLLTYRSIFILLERMADLMRALRLRGGLGGALGLRHAGAMASAVGMTLIHALGLAERQYSIMRLRGYESGIASGHYWHRLAGGDYALLACASGVLAASIAARVVL